jgi:hypothetical protein
LFTSATPFILRTPLTLSFFLHWSPVTIMAPSTGATPELVV